MSTPREYTCARCGNTYEYEWTDEEALKEMRATYGDLPPEDRAVICDDCFKEFEEWRLARQ